MKKAKANQWLMRKKNNGNYHEHKLYLWLQLLSLCASVRTLSFIFTPRTAWILFPSPSKAISSIEKCGTTNFRLNIFRFLGMEELLLTRSNSVFSDWIQCFIGLRLKIRTHTIGTCTCQSLMPRDTSMRWM